MSKWDKLIRNLNNMSSNIKYSDLKKILEYYGYVASETGTGSSYITFRKEGKMPITIPRKGNNIKKAYIKLVKDAVDKEENL